MSESIFAPQKINFGKCCYQYIDLPSLCGNRLSQLPYSFRLLLENVVRNGRGVERENAVSALFKWLEEGTSQKEIPFQPNRVLMHDTTSTPALVDMAAMRDTLAENGEDPTRINPLLQVDVSVDHSLAVEYYAQQDAASLNLKLEMQRNAERYRFMRWASRAFKNVHINPPGTGIMHTINLEQLATVVTVQEQDGESLIVPDVMLGTDSHTPMINGIGVLGWGVGGLEAQSVMFGMPAMIRIPEIVGVKFTGQLGANAQATDLALLVTHELRKLDVTGQFVEYFGPGVSSLTAGDRAVIANMAPEYGATTGYFAIDDNTLKYLEDTGRDKDAIGLVEHYARHNGLWFDPQAEPRYTRVLEIDLGQVGVQVAGPQRPQDLHNYADVPEVLSKLNYQPEARSDLPKHPVAIASITSCTNTTDPRLLITAGLLARNARKYALKAPSWVKTSLAPGSPASVSYLKRAGLVDDLAAVGFDIVGFGCATCIGNSGPLTPEISEAQAQNACKAVAALSGNRNFPGRVHPDLDLGFIMSPALVVAFGLVGDALHNLETEPIHITEDGKAIYLSDLWPTRNDVDAHVLKANDSGDYKQDFAEASKNKLWDNLDVPDSVLFPWDKDSTTLRRPPFASRQEGSQLGDFSAYPLLVLGDDVTTDHISPASAIPVDSFVGEFLMEKGEDPAHLNVFASRRGNWEVMMRGAFFNKSLKNLLAPSAPAGYTLHVPSGEVIPIWIAAERYREEDAPLVIVAGERYGMGSSRDWAAKGQRLLGIRAVLASSFERIHRSNLIGMGILPLLLPAGAHPGNLDIQPVDMIQVSALPDIISPHCKIAVKIFRSTDVFIHLEAKAAIETQFEVDLLIKGGVIPSILKQMV